MIELDFTRIRNHDGSKDGGFEELCCQLAHLSPPENAEYFVRKEGAGGDAGVECYWKLKDGYEHAWQAKYFIDPLGSNQWTQLSDSVKTALAKHPKLTKYYVCLPRDWTDSRKMSASAKPVSSAWDKWEEHVAKWQSLAAKEGRDVDFAYWCKHEISQMLQVDDPQFSGRALYWFNEPVLTHGHFLRVAEKSRQSLGDRYTPEFHLDLPIAKIFEGLAGTEIWWNSLKSKISDWEQAYDRVAGIFFKGNSPYISDLNFQNLKAVTETLRKELRQSLFDRTFIAHVNTYRSTTTETIAQIDQCFDNLYDLTKAVGKDEERQHNSVFHHFSSSTENLSKFINSNTTNAAVKRSILLVGEAGIGKSHLLCDIALHRLAKKLPTLFLLGQHYRGGNPLDSILDALDLRGHSYRQMLGALDAAGEAQNGKALIIIDAINEGAHRDDWRNHIAGFLSELNTYPNIAIVFSCRSTYTRYILPDDLIGKSLVLVEHYGFRGYEHRAANKYLSQQGIAKPSAPITAPEFTNPLFLKTCCKALKDRGETSFPKGLQGITRLFDFYVSNIENTIATQKRYSPSEKIIQDALRIFADKLYPNHLAGLPLREARKLINDQDINLSQGMPLFDLLIDEGVLAEDITVYDNEEPRGIPVVRFTYERFSDYFIAEGLLSKYADSQGIESAFVAGEPLAKIFAENKQYGLVGILSALSIYIGEKYGKELVDLIPDELKNDGWIFRNLFTDTLLWRTGSSFTKRSLELLNEVRDYGYQSTSLDILLALATEPSHPWNAEMLDNHLAKLKMPERDSFWSAHITISDSVEDEDTPESPLRSLIEWAYSGNLEGIESERVRLCSIVLLWMTSTSNRKVRDQATKSLVRMLCLYPDLLVGLLQKFSKNDDSYIVERLYAVAYGVVTNIADKAIIQSCAETVYSQLFSHEYPTPNILIRDNARGVMEVALQHEVLSDHIRPESFRPPYKSRWPVENPSIEDLDNITGDKYSSAIRSSLMGFPGDFGNYSMSCVHDWSPTPMGEGVPETAHNLKLKFAEHLSGDLKDRFVACLEIQKKINSIPFDYKQLTVKFASADMLKQQEKSEAELEFDKLKEEIESSLNDAQKEEFRWVMGLGRSDSVACFSRKWAQRWMCKRSYELGWTEKLFKDFEERHINYQSRYQNAIERIGKKYQWIALYEFLGHLADNCFFIDKGYSDADYSQYYGPWQLYKRNIDPTCWLRKTGDSGWDRWEEEFWWQPFVFPFHGESIKERCDWLWDEKIIPPFEKLLQVRDEEDGHLWSVLRTFTMWKKYPAENEDIIPYQDAWYRICACAVSKGDVAELEKQLKGHNLCSDDVVRCSSTGHQGFLREYPWHIACGDMNDSDGYYFSSSIGTNIRYYPLVSHYEWEADGVDQSIEKSIRIYVPSKTVIQGLSLSASLTDFGSWGTEKGEQAFLDQSAHHKGPSSALIRSDLLQNWLSKNDLQLVWLIGGEKQLFTKDARKFYGRLVYSGIYKLTEDGIVGENWFIPEHPRD